MLLNNYSDTVIGEGLWSACGGIGKNGEIESIFHGNLSDVLELLVYDQYYTAWEDANDETIDD